MTLPKPSLVFRGAVPHQSVECKQARGKASRKAYDQGHYYLQVPKLGGHMSTTAACYVCFPVAPDWITNLWQGLRDADNDGELHATSPEKCRSTIHQEIVGAMLCRAGTRQRETRCHAQCSNAGV